MKGLGISWSNVRNVMDMRAVYGGYSFHQISLLESYFSSLCERPEFCFVSADLQLL